MSVILFIAKGIKHLLYSLYVLVALVLLLITLGLFTHAGNILILDKLQTLEPRLVVSLSEGTILNSPTYELIRWSDGEMLYEFKQLSYTFDWTCLINELCLDSLVLESLQINIALSDSPEQITEDNSEPFKLTFPIPVHINHLDVNNANVKVAGVEIDVNRVLLSATGQENDITLSSTINGLTVVLADSKEDKSSQINKQKKSKTLQNFPAILDDQSLPEVILPFNL
ncbi:hypothetical protein N8878_06190, partial [Psychromonas sp.]|nr:hypothetical protein [Psychromonas sp.]